MEYMKVGSQGRLRAPVFIGEREEEFNKGLVACWLDCYRVHG